MMDMHITHEESRTGCVVPGCKGCGYCRWQAQMVEKVAARTADLVGPWADVLALAERMHDAQRPHA